MDRRFHRTTTGAKMTDVTGHTRGIIGPLAASGVKLLDIGPNGACTKPQVPPVFRWKDPEGRELLMLYHPDYGGVVTVPGSDLAIDVECRGDNSGPHKIDEIHRIYSRLRTRFPNAQITAGSLTDIANAVGPFREHLPVVTQEIADTWIAGVPSDPLKVARYLEMARLRGEWLASSKFQAGDATDRAFLADLLLETEHTWGADVKTWLDFDHYLPRDLQSMLDQPKYKVVLFSWQEKHRPAGRRCHAARTPGRRGHGAYSRARSRRAQHGGHATALDRGNHRDQTFRNRAGRENRGDFEADQQADTPRLGVHRASAGAVRLSDAGEVGLRPLHCRLPGDASHLGGDRPRQAQH